MSGSGDSTFGGVASTFRGGASVFSTGTLLETWQGCATDGGHCRSARTVHFPVLGKAVQSDGMHVC